MSTAKRPRPPLLGRFWVLALLLLGVCLVVGVWTTSSDWAYWGQPETRVTVTDVVSLDAERPPGAARTCRSPSELAVVDDAGRRGVLYDCQRELFEGDTTLARWHPEENRARDDVLSPGTDVAIGGGFYAGMLLVLTAVWWGQRRSQRAGRPGEDAATPRSR